MTQEIQVTITLQVDADLSKDSIRHIILNSLPDRSSFSVTRFSVADIKEESEIYQTEQTTKP